MLPLAFNMIGDVSATVAPAGDVQPASSAGRMARLPAYDLHNHTIYCGHADEDATVLDLLSRASALNLQYIGFSEHVMQRADLEAMRTISGELKNLVSMGAQPLYGAEMDVDTTDPEGRWVVPDIQCDYVILSAHGFPQFDMEIPDADMFLPTDVQRVHLASRWLNWYGKAIARGGFHILGHPLREPIAMNLLDLNEPEIMDLALRIFRPAIDHGIVFELNDPFIGALELTNQYDPYLVMVRRLKQSGMKFSRGSDSHGLLKVGAAENIALLAHDAELAPSDWFDPAGIHHDISKWM